MSACVQSIHTSRHTWSHMVCHWSIAASMMSRSKSNQVFKVSTPAGTHDLIWYATGSIAASMMSRSKSNQVCIKCFCRSSMSWIFVSYRYCCITPQISKFQAHDDPGRLWWSYDTSHAIFFGNITRLVFWFSKGSAATLIRWGGWSSYHPCAIHFKSKSESCIKIRWFLQRAAMLALQELY